MGKNGQAMGSSRRRCPVLGAKARYRGKVAVSGHNGAIAKRERDGGDLDVDQLHGAANAAELGV